MRRIKRNDDVLIFRFPARDKNELKVLADHPQVRRETSDLARWLVQRGMDDLKRQLRDADAKR